MALNPVERLRFLPLTVIGAALGIAAVWLAKLPVDPEPRLYEDLFHLIRSEEDPFEITSEKRLPLLRPLGDFDLVTQIELPTGSELDLLFHIVHPVRRDGGEMELFHARFDVLRVSTIKEGGPFLTREEALFDQPSPGGHLISAGHPATVHLQGRGHLVRANVAGKWTPWYESADSRGSIIMMLHGEGTALVRYLNLQPLQREVSNQPWLWCGAAGAIIGLLMGLFGCTMVAGLRALVALPVCAALAGVFTLWHLLPEVQPSLTGTMAAALSGLPLTVALAFGARLRALAIVSVAVLAMWELTVREEHRRMEPFEDPQLSAYLGRNSGEMSFDILGPELDADLAVHKPFDVDRRIVFAGGGIWYESGGIRAPEKNIGPLAAAQLGQKLGARVDGVVIPTLYSSAAQQYAMLERFVVGPFAPDAVVFAITADELDATEKYAPRDVFEGKVELPTGFGLELVRLWRMSWTEDVPAGSPEILAETLAELADLSKRRGFEVALYRPETLPGILNDVVVAAAQSHGWPVLDRSDGESYLATAQRHADALFTLFEN